MAYHRGASLLLLLALGACGSSPARASGQAQLDALLARAAPGATVKLPAGDYGLVLVEDRAFERPITLDATGARFEGLTLRRVKGMAIRGAQVTGSMDRNAILVRESQHVRLEGLTVRQARKAIIVNLSSDVVLRDNKLEGLRSDGINVALSRRVLIEGNQCRAFTPIKAEYDAAGKRVRDGDHADCIQLWSRPEAAPVSDIIIRRNVADGDMQGIFLGNHVRKGVDDGGYDRITIEDNDLTVAYPQGIGLYDARNSVVRNNRVRTIAGSRMPSGKAIRANINVIRGSGNLVCGNRLSDFPDHRSSQPCKG